MRFYQLLQHMPLIIIQNLTVSDTIDFGTDEEWGGAVILLPEVMKKTNIVKCYISTKQYITVFQVMPITKKLLREKLDRADGTYWLMEQFYTHDDDYILTDMKPYATIYDTSKNSEE